MKTYNCCKNYISKSVGQKCFLQMFLSLLYAFSEMWLLTQPTMSSHYQGGFFLLNVDERLQQWEIRQVFLANVLQQSVSEGVQLSVSCFNPTICLRVMRHSCDSLDKVVVCTFLNSTEAKKNRKSNVCQSKVLQISDTEAAVPRQQRFHLGLGALGGMLISLPES